MMVSEFVNAFGMTIPEVFEMKSQMFFIFYKYITNVTAVNMIHQIDSLNLAKSMQYADSKSKHKIDRQYKKVRKIAEGEQTK